MKALVTSGAGFIGSHLVDLLMAKDCEVVVIDNLSTGRRYQVSDQTALLQGDVGDADLLATAPPECDVVFHLAAVSSIQDSLDRPIEVHNANLKAMLALLGACVLHKVPRFVFLFSVVFVVMAYSLSHYRENSELQLRSLASLLDRLRAPILVSDADGNINFANRGCCGLLSCSLQDAKDSTFFSLFTHIEQRRKSIEQYLAHFENTLESAIEMTLSVRGSQRNFKSVGSIFELDGCKLLVSQLM
jgi:PAS domain-containing protein